MTKLYTKLPILLWFACFSDLSLSAQTIDKSYIGHWFYYTVGSPAKPDSNYTKLDTFVEMTFRKDGTYNYKGYIKTDVFTPGKGHLKFKKNFRYMDGNYQIEDNTLTLLSGFKADEIDLCTTYEFESITNKFKQEVSYFRLWDTRSFYEYAMVEKTTNNENFLSHKRKLQSFYILSGLTKTIDSTAFWTNSPDCPYEMDWPKPALLDMKTPLKKSQLDSINNLVEDLDRMYIYDTNNRLTRFYYTAKKEKTFFYMISYIGEANEQNTNIHSIKDSKDETEYIFIRDEKNCLQRIEQFNSAHQLIMAYYLAREN